MIPQVKRERSPTAKVCQMAWGLQPRSTAGKTEGSIQLHDDGNGAKHSNLPTVKKEPNKPKIVSRMKAAPLFFLD